MAGGGSSRGPAIGIDLGTTYSSVGVWRNNRVEIIQNDQGNKTTPSIVAFTDTNRLIGESAKNEATRNYKNTVFDVKRLIGRRFGDASVQSDLKFWPFKVVSGEGDKPMIVVQYKGERKEFPPEQISSFVLIKMVDIAKAFLGCPIKDVVVTVPAYFNERQRQATKDAGKIAELNVMAILNEPTAAAMAYGFHKKPNSIILIFDLGGGTFDITIAEVKKGNINVMASTGDSHLGGVDFDNNMVRYLIQEFKRKYSVDISGDLKVRKKLQCMCERAKRTLSLEPQTKIEIDSIHNIDFSYTISRARFEELNRHLFEKCIDKVKECLSYKKMVKSEIQDVVLVGGSTKIPKVRSMLQEFFNGKVLCQDINPDEAVAYGAALQAACLSKVPSEVPKMVLHDVTPLSLGIWTKGDLFHTVVPGNTTIPTKMEKVYVTTEDNQSSFGIKVYQGERKKAKDNVLLHTCVLKGIPQAPRGVSEMTVCFKIDTNGILTVTAVDKVNGNRIEVTIDKDQRRLSKEEIERMVKDGKRYKDYDDKHEKSVKAKNDLEGSLIDLKNSLKDGYIKPQDKAKIQSQIGPIEQWLKNVKLVDGVQFRREYDEHRSRLKKAEKIVNRSGESPSLAGILKALSIALNILHILGTVGMLV